MSQHLLGEGDLENERKKIQENLNMVNSKLGWIISERKTTKECRQDKGFYIYIFRHLHISDMLESSILEISYYK